MPSKPSSAALAEFELLVLLAVMQTGAEAYPLAIRDAIEARTGRSVSRAAVFVTLERLEEKGLVVSRYGDPTPVRGGRAKRFFNPTPSGLAAVKRSVAMVTSMTAGLEALLRKA
jgi:PadR family transcriptional regulator, regulatory protein PadR